MSSHPAFTCEVQGIHPGNCFKGEKVDVWGRNIFRANMHFSFPLTFYSKLRKWENINSGLSQRKGGGRGVGQRDPQTVRQKTWVLYQLSCCLSLGSSAGKGSYSTEFPMQSLPLYSATLRSPPVPCSPTDSSPLCPGTLQVYSLPDSWVPVWKSGLMRKPNSSGISEDRINFYI